ncbi:MAG TPA: 50S ribosomal protein L30 [Candidatus Fournierella merdipullorum]|uniref:Large ribosomal subunit protein uL30 n=1 Tax=Candidatus Allofournierella merdipullorum TaxID=2838595 RepID=A0A9D2E610_9FIRM|nr:50S ribosomal protein L30 [Candidatus Fournierella merdipullorum]
MAETEKKVAATEAAAEKKPAAKKASAAKKPAAKKAADGEAKPAAKKTTKKAADGEAKPAAKKTAKKAEVKAGTVTVKLVKSLSGRGEKQIATAKSLGLKKIGDVTVQPDNAQTAGKIAKISHMVVVTKA